ncbi:MAG: hypothetical protein ABI637_05730, partial [Gemmatimonadota bacterium]
MTPHPNHRRFRSGLFGLPLAMLVACSHSDAFTSHDPALTEPLVAGTPTRLTYNPGPDVSPSWLPDGRAIIYSFPITGREADRCLGIMPADGGSLSWEICNRGSFNGDSTDVFDWPAAFGDGRLAYYRTAKRVGTPFVASGPLGIAPLTAPDSFTTVRTFPFSAGGNFYVAPAFVRWVDASRLVFIGLFDTDIQPCPTCDFEAARIGRDILIADLSGGATIRIGGTDYATSVAVGENSDILYFTRANSSRVFRRSLSSGVETVAHDFDAVGIARDVHVAGGRLAAIVGGKVGVFFNGVVPVQRDLGGRLFVVELATGAEHELPVPLRLFRHPALSPAADKLAVEAYPFT